MNTNTKIKILWSLCFLVIYLSTYLLLHNVFVTIESPYKGMISAGLAGLLAPMVTEYETQTGSKIQIKWFFIKKIF